YHGKTDFYGLNTHNRLEFKHRKKDAVIGNTVESKHNIFPEYYLIEFERFQNVITTDIDEWIYFLKNSDIKPEFKSKNIQQVGEKLDVMKMSEEERKAYEKFLLDRASEKDVIETAMEEGRQGEKKETVIKMVKEGFKVDLIAKITGLTAEQIKELSVCRNH
ncbi:MAG TPA: hypothetical protein VJL89_03225, partial [Thermodesulfovibrionia bacterium]|nr:hypothetical protein [Thermodesulfovibrionia bacterium]